MADTLDVLTLSEAKDALNIPQATTTWDTQLPVLITAVSRRLDDLVGPVVQRTITGELHNGGKPWIRPFYTPVASVTSVTEYLYTSATTLTQETPGVQPASGFLLMTGRSPHDQWIVRRVSGTNLWFAFGQENIVVTYVAGRAADTASVDPKFKEAAKNMLRLIWRSGEGSGTSAFSTADYEGTPLHGFGFAVPNMVRDLLAEETKLPGYA